MRNWKRRVFVLTSTQLLYFVDGSNPCKEQPRGRIGLHDIEDVHALAERGAFEILTDSGKDYTIVAPDNGERERWLAAIADARTTPSSPAKLLQQLSRLHQEGLIRKEIWLSWRQLLFQGQRDHLEAIREAISELSQSSCLVSGVWF